MRSCTAAEADHSRHQSSHRSMRVVSRWRSFRSTPFATNLGAQLSMAIRTRSSVATSTSSSHRRAFRRPLPHRCGPQEARNAELTRIRQTIVHGGQTIAWYCSISFWTCQYSKIVVDSVSKSHSVPRCPSESLGTQFPEEIGSPGRLPPYRRLAQSAREVSLVDR